MVNPYSTANIPLGTYRLGKHIEDAHVYRIGHPLAENIIESCKSAPSPNAHLCFDYSASPQKISVLEQLVEQSGWLQLTHLTVSSFEAEDYLLFSGVTGGGVLLENDACHRLFSLQANVQGDFVTLSTNSEALLNQNLNRQKSDLIEEIGARNGSFFDEELEKLDKWGEDRRNSLKMALKDLDDQIKELKKQAKQAPNLPAKLKLEKERKKCESERDTAWRDYDEAAKEISRAKDALIEQIEQRLEQQEHQQTLFFISWNIV